MLVFRCICVFLVIPFSQGIEQLFTKTEYICNFDSEAILREISQVLSLDVCALLCGRDPECFSFQYNEAIQHCKTTKWTMHRVKNCEKTNSSQAVYVKGDVLLRYYS